MADHREDDDVPIDDPMSETDPFLELPPEERELIGSVTAPPETEDLPEGTGQVEPAATTTASDMRGPLGADGEGTTQGMENLYEELEDCLKTIHNTLSKEPKFFMFRSPVDTEEVYDYLDIIEKPMDLGQMQAKLDNHEYQDAQEYLKDIDLIVGNARRYNNDPRYSTNKVICMRARTLQDDAHKMVKAGTSFPRQIDKNSNPRRKSQSDFEQRRRPSLLVAQNQFREAYKEVQLRLESLLQRERPILPKDAQGFRSAVEMTNAANETLVSLADALLDVLHHQGATMEMQSVNNQLDQVQERLVKIAQDHHDIISPERSPSSQTSFGSSRTHMTTSSVRRNQAMGDLAARNARKQLDEQASQLELEAELEAEQLRLETERNAGEQRRRAEQLRLEADRHAEEQKRRAEQLLVEAERQAVQTRLAGKKRVLEKRQAAEQLRQDAERASLRAVIETVVPPGHGSIPHSIRPEGPKVGLILPLSGFRGTDYRWHGQSSCHATS